MYKDGSGRAEDVFIEKRFVGSCGRDSITVVVIVVMRRGSQCSPHGLRKPTPSHLFFVSAYSKRL